MESKDIGINLQCTNAKLPTTLFEQNFAELGSLLSRLGDILKESNVEFLRAVSNLGGGPMSQTAAVDDESPRALSILGDVRFIGALSGRYAYPDRPRAPEEKLPVYACRLRSISPRRLVAVGPVLGQEGETVSAHFNEFGIVRGRIGRRLASGFSVNLMNTEAERTKLGARIDWQKRHANAQVPNKREHLRILPRNPRTVIVLADGQKVPCFVIDLSRSGAAISAHFWPEVGMPMALGRLIGRVVRHLDVGFALQFIETQEIDNLEHLIRPPIE